MIRVRMRKPPVAHDGLQGSRVVYNLHNQGEPWQTVDATTLFDQSRNRFYVLRIGCTSECSRVTKRGPTASSQNGQRIR